MGLVGVASAFSGLLAALWRGALIRGDGNPARTATAVIAGHDTAFTTAMPSRFRYSGLQKKRRTRPQAFAWVLKECLIAIASFRQ
jgi:hypothetical protein